VDNENESLKGEKSKGNRRRLEEKASVLIFPIISGKHFKSILILLLLLRFGSLFAFAGSGWDKSNLIPQRDLCWRINY